MFTAMATYCLAGLVPIFQKGTLILEPAPTLYFLGIAAAKRSAIETLLARIAKRNARGKALILLQQCLERGDLSASEVAPRF
jgi:tRNA A37 threonylcarbamoyladenosine synthetase subunit TsaC/SUA5/YrdC